MWLWSLQATNQVGDGQSPRRRPPRAGESYGREKTEPCGTAGPVAPWGQSFRVKLTPGPHALKMYVPNTNTLRPNSHVRLYARAPGGAIVGGPVVPY